MHLLRVSQLAPQLIPPSVVPLGAAVRLLLGACRTPIAVVVFAIEVCSLGSFRQWRFPPLPLASRLLAATRVT